MATLFEIAALNWVARSKRELARARKRFRNSTIYEAVFWKTVCEAYGHRFSFSD
jgi:thiaminase